MVKNKSKFIGIALLTVIVMLSSSFVLGSYQDSVVKNPASEAVLSTSNGHLKYTDLNNNAGLFSSHTTLSHGENPLGAGSTISTISVGSFPWGIAYNNATQQIFVANSLSSDFSVIQSSTNTVSTINLPPSPFDIAYDPSNSYLYATDTTFSLLWVLTPTSPDSSTYQVISDITLPATGYGVAYDPGNNLIYVAIPSLNEVVALDTGTGALEATISLGISEPEYLVYVPTDNYMWVTDRGSNSVTVINSSLNQDAGGNTVGSNPIGIAYDPVNKDIYTANYGSENITGINTISGITSTISVPGQKVEGVTYDPINNLLYSTDYYNMNTLSAGNTVSVINTTTDSVVGTITVGNNPVFAAYNPANEDIYVTNSGSDTVSVISSPSVSVSSSPSSIDAGQTATLTANPTSGSGSYTSYSWYVKPPGYSSFSIVPGVTTQTLSYATSGGSTAGTYYFEATVTDSNGVTSLLSLESGLSIYSDPTVSISPSGPISYNVGQTASQLTASVTYSGPNTATVEWYSNTADSTTGGTDTGHSGTSFIPPTSATGTLYYFATVRDSAISGYSSSSGALEVTVNPIHHQTSVKYFAYFHETGLPNGTVWYITVDGNTYSSNTQYVNLIIPSGINNYTVGGVTGYSAYPSSGTIDVNYAPFATQIVFSADLMDGYLTGYIPSTFSLFINGVQYGTQHGEFNITLKPGNYTIDATYSGNLEYHGNVTISSSKSTDLRIETPRTTYDQTISALSPVMALTVLMATSAAFLAMIFALKLKRSR